MVLAMTTLYRFNRSSATFNEFDDDDFASSSHNGLHLVPVAPNDVNTASGRFFLTALIDHLCSLYEQNPHRREKLYEALCDLLIKARIISPAWTVTEFSSLRRQFNSGFISLLQAARDSISQDVPVVIASSGVRPQSIQLLLSSPAVPTSIDGPTDWLNSLPFKIVEEFTNIRRLDKGGFGKVYSARKKSDGITYAVKEILLDGRNPGSVLSTFNEVKIMAGLSHPNVIRYYDNWFEHKMSSTFRNNASGPCHTYVQPHHQPESFSSADRTQGVSLSTAGSRVLLTHDSGGDTEDEYVADDDYDDDSVQFVGSHSHHADNALAVALPDGQHGAANVLAVALPDGQHGAANVLPTGQYNADIIGQCLPRNSTLIRNSRRLQTKRAVAAVPQLMLYIQMELCHMTLKHWLDKRNNAENAADLINDYENKHLLKQMLKGLEYIHSQHLLHRDLKPQNIFMNLKAKGGYHVKIGDFGLSRLFAMDMSSNLCASHQPHPDESFDIVNVLSCGVGNDLYSAPEQLHSSHYTSKADMYSIGLMLFEMYHPFTTGVERQKCLKRLRDEHGVGTLDELWPLQANCILELTASNPDRRPTASGLLKGEFGLLCSKDQMIKELNTQLAEMHRQLHRKDQRIADLEQLLGNLNLTSKSFNS